MEDLMHLSWRLYVALPLMVLGTALAVWGINKGRNGLICALRGDTTHLVTLMEGFRLSIIGLALTGIGAAWVWHLTWLLALSLVIGGGETLESSIDIFALRRWSHFKPERPTRGLVETHIPGTQRRRCPEETFR
jgi:hypothetical protein